MSDRVTVAVSVVASPPPAPKTKTGTLFIAGVSSTAPEGVQLVNGISDFRTLFGERVELNSSLYDAVDVFFREGGSTAYVVAGDEPAYDDWTAFLNQFTADLGPGVVAIAGVGSAIAAEYLAAHCKITGRLGLICGVASESVGDAVTAAGVASAEEGADHLVYVWPWVTIPGVTDPIEPLGFAAGVRARAHTSSVGAAQSPIALQYGTSRYVNGVETAITDDDFDTANDGKVSVIRIMGGKLRQYGWTTIANMEGDTDGTLAGGQFMDIINAIAWDASQIAENYVGHVIDGRGIALGAFTGDLNGVCQGYATTGALFAACDANGKELDSGYSVNTGVGINPPTELAKGNLKADIGVRLSPTAEFVNITIAAANAAGSI